MLWLVPWLSCSQLCLRPIPGPYISISVAVFARKPTIEPVACIALDVHSSNTERLAVGMRLIGSLRVALQELKDHYGSLHSDSELGHLAQYPFRNSYKVGNETYCFSYIQALQGKCVFRARLRDGNAVVVKFTRTYGIAAHQRASALGIAPRLISSEWIYGWCMVVMDDISDSHETLHAARNRIIHDAIPLLRQKVKDMLGKLHQEAIVHGDIRSVNIMVRKPEAGSHIQEHLIVDWDWAGMEDTATYPANLNPDVQRPPGVQVGGVITRAHDLAMAEWLGKN